MKYNPPKKAIIYCRVSTPDQVKNTSLKAQERVCRDFASKKGIGIIKTFVDEGESAKTKDRPQFMKAVSFCTNKKNDIGYFIVYKIDRFSRNQDDHVSVRALLNKSDVELRSATEPIDASPVGKAMEGMISVFAEFDNNVRSERTKGGMVERVKQGAWVWVAPLGYYRRGKSMNIEPEPSTAPYINLIFREYAKGTYTYKSLAKYVEKRGL